jgi:hypothetical protein
MRRMMNEKPDDPRHERKQLESTVLEIMVRGRSRQRRQSFSP